MKNINKMKYVKTFEKYYIEGDKIYHYTSLENALKIIDEDFLIHRRYSVTNKYSTGIRSQDYGYISFTENDEYHDEISSDIPIECRFVFSIKKLEKVYKLVKYDANDDELDDYKDRYDIDNVDDLDKNDIPYYGDEMELRIYGNDIPIKKYLIQLELSYESEDSGLYENIIEKCKEKNIKCIKNVY